MDPFILTTFNNATNTTVGGDESSLVSFVIFEWHDEHLLGVFNKPDDLSVRERKSSGSARNADDIVKSERDYML